MPNEVRNELTPKYRGIYDKAKTGRSMKSAIHIGCLICTACKTKLIKDCEIESCAFHQYRPYQDKPRKLHKPTNTSNLHRSPKGQIVKSRTNSPQRVSKVIEIPKALSGRVRVTVAIEPESKNKEK